MNDIFAQTVQQGESTNSRRSRWFAWLLGAAILVTVISAVHHASEERALIRVVENAQLSWLLVVIFLQAATYAAHGEILRTVSRSRRIGIPFGEAYRLSLAMLFVDQALPTGGLSGATLVARVLSRKDVPRDVVMSTLVTGLVSYYAAYVVCLAAGLSILVLGGHSSSVITAASVLFAGFALILMATVLTVSGHPLPGPVRGLERLRVVRSGLELLNQADPALVRSLRLLAQATGWQIVIILLDAGSLWTLVRAVGASATVPEVFAAFMVASLLRTIGFIPGGLGTFEAACVFGLKSAGVPFAEALSATLLFRGLSFWLPMLPGVYFSRSALGGGPTERQPFVQEAYWSLEQQQLYGRLQAAADGLNDAEAARRLEKFGPNELLEQRQHTAFHVLGDQLRSPLLVLLVFAGAASALTGDWTDAVVILVILTASVGIGYSREYRAATAASALRERIRTHANVVRGGRAMNVPHEQIVPGDVVHLSAGSLVPADAVVLDATDFFVSQALLTGESFPVEKRPGAVPLSSTLSQRTNCLYLGTNVRSGTARCLVVNTGDATEIGSISHRLTLRPPQTEFDRGILRFGYLVTSAMLIMVVLVFAVNVFLGRPAIQTLLFSIALAVGMSPELLPAILNVNLARGATLMAQQGVLVRHLNSIENLGSMTVLCTDKTGTLTEGVIRLEGAFDTAGASSKEVLSLASLNAALQAGLSNPLDEAILTARTPDLSDVEKLGEIPYDFNRKRLSVIIRQRGDVQMITKGAFEQVLSVCTSTSDGRSLDEGRRAALVSRFENWSRQGIRVLAVATRQLLHHQRFGREDECELTIVGFLTFLDHPKAGAAEAISDLRDLGVAVKIITGDARLVAQHVAGRVGLRSQRVVTGKDLLSMHDDALWNAVDETDLFAEVDPNQKERVILALRKRGHVVGFLGDGINDAPAMHAADTSISVDQAADVAKEAADFVLLDRHLDVIRRGIEEGRTTFANTLKYILTTMSANLGNMLSMAVASVFLPFLPLLPGQILLNNFLSDIPAIGLAGDAVDRELIERPRRWNMRFIGRFMVEFGLLSSLFDVLTFAALIAYFAAPAEMFRTAWFTESLLTELLIALVVRTRRPSFRSRPGNILLVSTFAVICATFAIPYLPFASVLGFVPLPKSTLGTILVITALYVLVTEFAKSRLYRNPSR